MADLIHDAFEGKHVVLLKSPGPVFPLEDDPVRRSSLGRELPQDIDLMRRGPAWQYHVVLKTGRSDRSTLRDPVDRSCMSSSYSVESMELVSSAISSAS